jgi:hypothetical protein
MNHNWVDYVRLLETLFATEREQELKYQGYFINNNFVRKLKIPNFNKKCFSNSTQNRFQTRIFFGGVSDSEKLNKGLFSQKNSIQKAIL